MTLTENLKIGSTFLIFLVSVIGFYSPVYLYDVTQKRALLRNDDEDEAADFAENPLFMLTKSFAAGIILGVALMHLLPDGQADLEGIADYPVSLALVCTGIILTLCLEQLMAYWGGFHSHGHHHHEHKHHQHNHHNRKRGGSEDRAGIPQQQIQDVPDLEHSHHFIQHKTYTPELFGESFEIHDHAHNHRLNNGDCDETCGIHECPHTSSNCGDAVCEAVCDDVPGNIDHDHTHDHTSHDYGHSIDHVCCSDQTQTSMEAGQINNIVNPVAVVGASIPPVKANAVAINEALIKSQKKAFVKSMVLEISVAIHSVIVGFGFGLLSSAGALRVLMVALSLHQLFEGISLGTMISETSLSRGAIAMFAVIFAFTMPIGIIIGMLTSESTAGSTVKGYANSIAAGSLVYASLVEMVAEIFNSEKLVKHPAFRFLMVFVFTLGCTLLGGLAVWA